MKSLLGRMGLSPLHIKRPSFIVVLNLMNTFVLDPDTLFKVEKGKNSKINSKIELGQSSFKKNPEKMMQYFSLLVLWVTVLQPVCMLMCEGRWFTTSFPAFRSGGIELVPPESQTQ